MSNFCLMSSSYQQSITCQNLVFYIKLGSKLCSSWFTLLFLSVICLHHNQLWTYLRGYSLIHPMSISTFNLHLTQKLTRSLLTSMGPQALLLLLLLLLFVFNIYVLVVVITVISSVRRVITNDQRLTEYSRLYISNTFLSYVMPSFPINLSNAAETLPRAVIIAGTISTFLNFHNLLISFSKSWYFSTFFFFSSTLTSAGTAISVIIPFCSFLSITFRSGRLASIRLSHQIFMSHSTLISSFSTAPSGACPCHFSLCSNLFFLQISQLTFVATLSCRLLYSF